MRPFRQAAENYFKRPHVGRFSEPHEIKKKQQDVERGAVVGPARDYRSTFLKGILGAGMEIT